MPLGARTRGIHSFYGFPLCSGCLDAAKLPLYEEHLLLRTKQQCAVAQHQCLSSPDSSLPIFCPFDNTRGFIQAVEYIQQHYVPMLLYSAINCCIAV